MVLLMDEKNNIMEERAVIEDSSDAEFSCGDPKVEPHVGDEFQAEIPPMMSASKRAVFLSTPLALDDVSYSFLIGQPVQVMWIEKHRQGQGNGNDNVDMSQSLRSLRAERSRFSAKIRGKSDKNSKSKKRRLNLEAVPAIPSSSWEDFEVASFVLGLYTFGKNFTQLKTFMDNKGIGEIVLFYYGKFYNSGKYHSWSYSRKKQNRKCVCGKKLYSGWRQHQLLSRLIPSIPDESQKQMLVDVSKSFAEGNITLEKYVSTMKDLVGIRLLVDAVAIGKGKEDLTVVTAGPLKTKPWFTVSPKPSLVRSSRAYTSLTPAEIINQLTGSSRLSKARCNDIFWEAVWPRLLARGWHSEQPKDRSYIKSKDNIVFIVPGVKQFSRGKLVKGDHYFDSISDILTKVASEPELLEFETGGEIREAAANGFVDAEKSSDEKSSPSDSQRNRYLRSPCSNHETLQLKFTVVDSSFAAGGKLCDLRNLNTESLVSESKARLGGKDSSVLENSLDSQNAEKSQMMPLDANNQVDDPMRFTNPDTSLDHRQKLCFRRWKHLPGDDTKMGNVGADSGSKEETLEKVKDSSKRLINHKLTRGAETNYHSVNSVPLLKRRRLSAGVRKEKALPSEAPAFKHLPGDDTERKVCSESDQLSLCAVQHLNSAREEMNEDKERYETVLSVDYMKLKSEQSKKTGTGLSSSLAEIQEPNGLNSISGVDNNCSSKQIRTVHELISSEQEANRLCSVSHSDNKRASNDLGTAQEFGSSEQQLHDQQINTDGPRRQSTRKRPLTTRALEALESGFLTTKRMKTMIKPRKHENSTKKQHSAKACNRARVLSDNGNADLEHRGEDRSNFSKKATATKPLEQIKTNFHITDATTENKTLDQIQDSKPVLTGYPKLPPIILKLHFKRG